MLGCQVVTLVKASPLDGRPLPSHQHEHVQTHLCDLEQVPAQTALKWPSVMFADKGHFGEWVKRRMNYQNRTKQKTTLPPKKKKKD